MDSTNELNETQHAFRLTSQVGDQQQHLELLRDEWSSASPPPVVVQSVATQIHQPTEICYDSATGATDARSGTFVVRDTESTTTTVKQLISQKEKKNKKKNHYPFEKGLIINQAGKLLVQRSNQSTTTTINTPTSSKKEKRALWTRNKVGVADIECDTTIPANNNNINNTKLHECGGTLLGACNRTNTITTTTATPTTTGTTTIAAAEQVVNKNTPTTTSSYTTSSPLPIGDTNNLIPTSTNTTSPIHKHISCHFIPTSLSSSPPSSSAPEQLRPPARGKEEKEGKEIKIEQEYKEESLSEEATAQLRNRQQENSQPYRERQLVRKIEPISLAHKCWWPLLPTTAHCYKRSILIITTLFVLIQPSHQFKLMAPGKLRHTHTRQQQPHQLLSPPPTTTTRRTSTIIGDEWTDVDGRQLEGIVEEPPGSKEKNNVLYDDYEQQQQQRLRSKHKRRDSRLEVSPAPPLDGAASFYAQLYELRRQAAGGRLAALGAPCLTASDCSKSVVNSHCQVSNFTCACLPNHVEYNSTTCLAPSLLGFPCLIDGQCQAKVANSYCASNGLCACREEDKFVPFRRDKCLPATKLDEYCLTNQQCSLNDKHSYCKWKITNVYGTCKCPPNYKLISAPELQSASASSLSKSAAAAATQLAPQTLGKQPTNITTTRCVPRLGDSCFSSEECQLATENSICAPPPAAAAATATSSAHKLPEEDNTRDNNNNYNYNNNKKLRAWQTSSASERKCECAHGFKKTANMLSCLPAAAAVDSAAAAAGVARTSTTTTTASTTKSTLTTTTTTMPPAIVASSKHQTTQAKDDDDDDNELTPPSTNTNENTPTPTTSNNNNNKVDEQQHQLMHPDVNSSTTTTTIAAAAAAGSPLQETTIGFGGGSSGASATTVYHLLGGAGPSGGANNSANTSGGGGGDKHQQDLAKSRYELVITTGSEQEKKTTNATAAAVATTPKPGGSSTKKQATDKSGSASSVSLGSATAAPAVALFAGSNNNNNKMMMSSLGKRCSHDVECKRRDTNSYCDTRRGVCECLRPSVACSSNSTGCHRDTFQCRSGQCVSWYFVCDQFKNCDDGSDEEDCGGSSSTGFDSSHTDDEQLWPAIAPGQGGHASLGGRRAAGGCPAESFKCSSGNLCLSFGKLCNGKADCPDASDELHCGAGGSLLSSNKMMVAPSQLVSRTTAAAATGRPGNGTTQQGACHPRAFTCANGQCLPAYVFCNAVTDCSDGSDESELLCERTSSQLILHNNQSTKSSSTTDNNYDASASQLLQANKSTTKDQAMISQQQAQNWSSQQIAAAGTTKPAAGGSVNSSNSAPGSSSFLLQDSPLLKADRAEINKMLAALQQQRRRPNAGRQQHQQQRHWEQASSIQARRRSSRLGAEFARPAGRPEEELMSASECPRWAFTCGNGKCRSSAILCSGVDGCGDNSDERHCEVCKCLPPSPPLTSV